MTTALASRGLAAFPILGPIFRGLARDIGRDPTLIFYILTILLTVLVLAIRTWGLVALGLSALAMVPVMFVVLVLLTRG